MGRLHEVMEIIGKSDIRIIAAMVADTTEYGILRLITSDTEKAFQVLKEHDVSVNRSEVIALSAGASVGAFSQRLQPFAKEKIEEVNKGIVPCLIAELAVLLLITYVPAISTFLIH